MGSVVLGLNDAQQNYRCFSWLTLALSDSRLIALTGSITGIAAALSMASSEYLSTKSENGNENGKHPVKASIYTGIAYIFTVVALVAPFIFISNVLMALGLCFIIALSIIALFNYYYSIARSESFRKRFYRDGSTQFQRGRIKLLDRICVKRIYGHRCLKKSQLCFEKFIVMSLVNHNYEFLRLI